MTEFVTDFRKFWSKYFFTVFWPYFTLSLWPKSQSETQSENFSDRISSVTIRSKGIFRLKISVRKSVWNFCDRDFWLQFRSEKFSTKCQSVKNFSQKLWRIGHKINFDQRFFDRSFSVIISITICKFSRNFQKNRSKSLTKYHFCRSVWYKVNYFSYKNNIDWIILATRNIDQMVIAEIDIDQMREL